MRSEFFRVLIFLTFACLATRGESRSFDDGAILQALSGVRVHGNCSYRVNGDLTDHQPLYLKYNTTEFLLPNSTGIVELSNGEKFDMYCSAGFAEPLLNRKKITAQCLQGSFHLVDGLIRNFTQFVCQDHVFYTARRTNMTCNGGTLVAEIGFDLGDDNFVRTMTVCHDEINEVNRYAHYKLYPGSHAYQRYVARPLFIVGNFYNCKDINEYYTKAKQKSTFDAILGENSAKYFNGSELFLARGHLSDKLDYVYGSAQRATFFYINAAPQWEIFNTGSWQNIEYSVKNFVAQQGITVDCYTGTWGVSTLPNVNGTEKELYLNFDENGKGLIPVPKIYFKLIFEPVTKKGVVIIGVNNPHLSLEQIQRDYVICDDISEKLPWLKWNKECLQEGYIYACSLPQFTETVKDLPEFDGGELLY